MKYRYETTSLEGFIQQLACNYIPHGYWFYVAGWVPEGKSPASIDQKLTQKYGVCISRQSRARRKVAGLANLHYLRYDRYFLLIATHGRHEFFADEVVSIRDIRKAPVRIHGYSISFKRGGHLIKKGGEPAVDDHKWHTRVQIEREKYTELKAHFLDQACKWSVERFAREIFNLPFEPYAPVRQQLLALVRAVNKRRHAASLELISFDCIRYQRSIVKPFEYFSSSASLESQLELSGRV